jgi:hypothetical protein
MKAKQQTTQQREQAAVRALFNLACNDATPAQMLSVADQFEVEVWTLEGLYLDKVEALADC